MIEKDVEPAETAPTTDALEKFDMNSPPSSPYSKHRQYRSGITTINTHDEGQLNDDEIVIVFESHEGSPYSRRYPATDKSNRCVRI